MFCFLSLYLDKVLWHMQFNIPIYLTLFRIFLIPFFVFAFYLPFYWSSFLTALIFMLAAITDWLDGFLARRWKQTSRFGAFLDPVADKIMVSAALVVIVEYFHIWWITLPTAIIITREIIISALRQWMAVIGYRNNVAVLWIAKVKTILQMLSLFVLLWHPTTIFIVIGVIIFYVATTLTFLSMFRYFRAVCNDLLTILFRNIR